MANPIAPAKGIAFAFPDVCKTPSPSGPIPIPYPNIAQLADADAKSDASGAELLVGSSGDHVLLKDAEIPTSTGDQAGSIGGVKSGTVGDKCALGTASGSVLYGPDGKGLVRFLDPTEQNAGNATGMVLSAFPTVLVGD